MKNDQNDSVQQKLLAEVRSLREQVDVLSDNSRESSRDLTERIRAVERTVEKEIEYSRSENKHRLGTLGNLLFFLTFLSVGGVLFNWWFNSQSRKTIVQTNGIDDALKQFRGSNNDVTLTRVYEKLEEKNDKAIADPHIRLTSKDADNIAQQVWAAATTKFDPETLRSAVDQEELKREILNVLSASSSVSDADLENVVERVSVVVVEQILKKLTGGAIDSSKHQGQESNNDSEEESTSKRLRNRTFEPRAAEDSTKTDNQYRSQSRLREDDER